MSLTISASKEQSQHFYNSLKSLYTQSITPTPPPPIILPVVFQLPITDCGTSGFMRTGKENQF